MIHETAQKAASIDPIVSQRPVLRTSNYGAADNALKRR